MKPILRYYISASLKDREEAAKIKEFMLPLGESTFDWWLMDETPSLAEDMVASIKKSDTVLFLPPGGRGSHIELGVALGNNIPIVCLSEDRLAFPRSIFYNFHISFDSLTSFYRDWYL